MTEEITLQVEDSTDTEVGQNNVLCEGEYFIVVPPGQRAIVTYEYVDKTITKLDAGD